MKPIKYTIIAAALFVAPACETKETTDGFADDIGDTIGTEGSTGTDTGGCEPETSSDTGVDPDGCASPYIVDSLAEPLPALPIASNEVYPLPLGGYLRYIEREGATTTVLIFAGLSGAWPSASSYLQGVDTTTLLPSVNLAIVETVNPYGVAHDYTTIDPALFTPGPGEAPHVTWGWEVWNPGDDPNDPDSPGAYPPLVATGDAIEAVVPDVDYFINLGKEARSIDPSCIGQYDCNGRVVMAYGSPVAYTLAGEIADDMAAAFGEAWTPWDLDNPLGGGFVYDDPLEGIDRWLGTAAHWANETWGAEGIEVILPLTAPATDCAPLLAGEPEPLAADAGFRARSNVERAAAVATVLRALDSWIK